MVRQRYARRVKLQLQLRLQRIVERTRFAEKHQQPSVEK